MIRMDTARLNALAHDPRRRARRSAVVGLAAVVAWLAACQPAPGPPGAADPPDPPGPPPAPWSAAPVPATEAPPALVREWERAPNRATCAPLVPTDTGPEGAAAEPRRASFGGGWGVAWDLPELRSAFGIAGTGVEPGPDTFDDWPHRRVWADGSRAGYGPEGGTGPNQLAYLRLTGQRCLYNVWSRIGVEHLERILDGLRYVAPE